MYNPALYGILLTLIYRKLRVSCVQTIICSNAVREGGFLFSINTLHNFYILNWMIKIGGFPIEIETQISKLNTYTVRQ